ncbi:MAG: DUF3883 domain-containing protein [Nitrososphaerota archaeon]|nr:DUF3883 domain-containing protein [Nitrososphaerota archaeon]
MDLLDFACRAGWIQEQSDGSLVVLRNGSHIAAINDIALSLAAQLEDIVLIARPTWAAILTRGRKEFALNAPADVVQCFREAGLLDGTEQSTINLLDSMAQAMRVADAETKLGTGRQGERLTVEYEEYRTLVRPEWTSVETNLAGYDVLSRESRTSSRPLPIEVKSTSSTMNDGFIYVTRNEFERASTMGDYKFHCWILTSPPRLLDVPKNEMFNHVPRDQNEGAWQKVRIPYSVLTGFEVQVPPTVGRVLG